MIDCPYQITVQNDLMSNVNIQRAVQNIRSNTTAYTPVIEFIVNAIQAIEETEKKNGKVEIRVKRSEQGDLVGGKPDIVGFIIKDNGIGFTEKHRKSFDTLYSDMKLKLGGKGFGRFTALKYFDNLYVKSTFLDGQEGYKERSFSMGKDHDIIINEKVKASDKNETCSEIVLEGLLKPAFEKTLEIVASKIVEYILPYFLAEDYPCPQITLSEEDGSGLIVLNKHVNREESAIQEIDLILNVFELDNRDEKRVFTVRLFKIYSPGNQKSKISLVAHKREVSGNLLHKYIPEFFEEFYDQDNGSSRNFIIKAYVFGDYLDENVSLERGAFDFPSEGGDLALGIGQSQIENEAAKIAQRAMDEVISSRKERKAKEVQGYVDAEAPWHKSSLRHIDLSDLPYRPTREQIEITLQREIYKHNVAVKQEVSKIMNASTLENMQETVVDIVNKVSEASQSELIHYVALRRSILELFEKSLEVKDDGSYESEGLVHDIIFPRKGDSDNTCYKEHNLWLVDERLNFTTFVSSDKPLSESRSDRPDVLVFGKRVSFRAENEQSNPITIFEFKRPQRDDFANPSSTEDPVAQIIRYVNKIKDGHYKTPEGRDLNVSDNTPFYGYVVCDINSKVKKWLESEKDFTPMPDGKGWFAWNRNINLYIEVLSWDKVLKDAKMRNKIFFHKLGIE